MIPLPSSINSSLQPTSSSPFPSIDFISSYCRHCRPSSMAPDMASPAHELTLDFRPSTAYQKPHGDQQPALQQNQKIHEFLSRLEEERRKIDAFKRELPLCMQLLNNAIEIYKQQLEAFHRTGDGHAQRPVLEEFIPLKQVDGGDGGGADPKAAAPSEKANWMVSAQLWSPALEDARPLAALAPTSEAEHGGFDVRGGSSPKLALDSKQRNGGAFVPFSKEKNKTCGGVRAANPRAIPELKLAPTPEKPVEEKKKCAELEVNGSRENSCTNGKGGSPTEATGAPAALPTHRKARRCWSPDLHRRFVNALQILGGSQVATPKQIRELMKVDGLTNDEVKSHLQKYRLHTRRPPPAPQAPAAAGPQLVVLGGIWVQPEFAAPAGGASTIYGAAQAAAASAHYCSAAAPVLPEFYPMPQQAVAPQHHLQHAPAGGYKVRASPESEVGSDGGEQSESVEEGEERKEEVEDEEDGEEAARAEGGGVALKF